MMFVMTAKVDKKKMILILAAVLILAAAMVLLLGGEKTEQTASVSVAGNEDRVRFLRDFGWEAAATPKESGLVRIPKETTEVFDRYNQLQKSQGYDLAPYAGKSVMRYVYEITNYPGATEPVYATLLIYKNQVIGGDITDTAAKGAVRGFRMAEKTPETETTAPETAPPTT